jgi:hypothetical protein
MSKLTETVYLTLQPSRFIGNPRRATEFRVTGMRKTPPPTKANEVAIKIQLAVDANLFAEYIPVVEVEIDDRSVLPRVEVIEPDLDELE